MSDVNKMLVAFLHYEIKIIYTTFKIFQMIVLNIIHLLIKNYGIKDFIFLRHTIKLDIVCWK